MSSESIMPVSTQSIVLEQYNQLKNNNSDPAQKLNEMFFSMMMKSMFDVAGSKSESSSTTKLHQQLYVNTLTQELSKSFNVGFTQLQYEINQREK